MKGVTQVAKLMYVQPINYVFSPIKGSHAEILEPLSDAEVAQVISLAERVGYTSETSFVGSPPFTDRIRLNDPNGQGYPRDYFAQIE